MERGKSADARMRVARELVTLERRWHEFYSTPRPLRERQEPVDVWLRRCPMARDAARAAYDAQRALLRRQTTERDIQVAREECRELERAAAWSRDEVLSGRSSTWVSTPSGGLPGLGR